MKALVWEAPRVMMLREQPKPAVGAGEILIKVAHVGICGSELSGYLGHNALRVPPLVMGHEFAGDIVDLGAETQSRYDFAVGQTVTVNPFQYDGTCEFCIQGLNQLCTSRKLIGAHRPGAYAEFISVPAELATILPAGMPTHTGAMTEPVAVGVRIGEMAGRLDGEPALVAGAGAIGLLALQALFLNGASRVFISDLVPSRLAMGAALGGETIDPRKQDVVKTVREATGGRGVMVSVDCVGAAITRQQCVSATRSTCTVILSGLHEETSAMPAAEIIRREIVVRGAFSYSPANFAEGLLRLENKTMGLDPWVVEAPLADGGKWFDRLIDAPGDVAKVLLVP